VLLGRFDERLMAAERDSAFTLGVNSENCAVFVKLGVMWKGRVNPLVIFHRLKQCSFALLEHVLGSQALLLLLDHLLLDQLALLHDTLWCALLDALESPFLELAIH
jgi:hypothetical protein